MRSIRLLAIVQIQQETRGIVRQMLIADTQNNVPQFIDTGEIQDFVLEERPEDTNERLSKTYIGYGGSI